MHECKCNPLAMRRIIYSCQESAKLYTEICGRPLIYPRLQTPPNTNYRVRNTRLIIMFVEPLNLPISSLRNPVVVCPLSAMSLGGARYSCLNDPSTCYRSSEAVASPPTLLPLPRDRRKPGWNKYDFTLDGSRSVYAL